MSYSVVFLSYQLQQQAIMPLVASTYALSFGLNYAKQWYVPVYVYVGGILVGPQCA